MRVDANEAGGTTVVLVAGDDLGAVPRSHHGLLTPDLRAAFADPPAYLRRAADRHPAPAFARWLRALLDANRWELRLDRGSSRDHVAAGFLWSPDQVRSAAVNPPDHAADLRHLPPALRDHYRLVDLVDWMGFACAGKLSGAGRHPVLWDPGFDYHGAAVDPRRAYQWGDSPRGDVLFYTADGRAGWFNLATHELKLVGTIPDALDRLGAALLAGRCPDYSD